MIQKFTFLFLQFIWIESLAFFAANVGLLSKFVRMYREEAAHLNKKIE